MPVAPKKIKFEDIQVGDKIRVVDVVDSTVTSIEEDGVWLENGLWRSNETVDKVARTFQLFERPIPPLPTKRGSVILVAGGVYVLRGSDAYLSGLWQGTAGWADVHNADSMRNMAQAAGGFGVIR